MRDGIPINVIDPVVKEFRLRVYDNAPPCVEVINLISQIMELSYKDITDREKTAIAEWFYTTYKIK